MQDNNGGKNNLEQYKILVRFLGEYLGPNYEIVLHDISKLPNTIVAIANGKLSGRSVGGPITNSALQMLHDKVYLNKDYVVNYKGRSKTEEFRSATLFLKDESDELYGLLCFNFTDKPYKELHSRLMEIIHPEDWENAKGIDRDDKNANEDVEQYYDSIDELMDNIYQETVSNIKVPLDYMKQEDRLNIVKELDSKGMFKLKGSVAYAADHLQCSQATIYRYLNMIGK